VRHLQPAHSHYRRTRAEDFCSCLANINFEVQPSQISAHSSRDEGPSARLQSERDILIVQLLDHAVAAGAPGKPAELRRRCLAASRFTVSSAHSLVSTSNLKTGEAVADNLPDRSVALKSVAFHLDGIQTFRRGTHFCLFAHHIQSNITLGLGSKPLPGFAPKQSGRVTKSRARYRCLPSGTSRLIGW